MRKNPHGFCERILGGSSDFRNRSIGLAAGGKTGLAPSEAGSCGARAGVRIVDVAVDHLGYASAVEHAFLVDDEGPLASFNGRRSPATR